MIKLYVSPSCTSCRKAKAWLEEQNLEFEEKNIFHEPLSQEEIKNILSLTEEGTEEIISYRSQAYQSLDVDIEDLSMNQLLNLFKNQPSLIRRPIIMDDRRLQIGYNEEEIRCFLPREVRELELAEIHRQLANEEAVEIA
ncbi:transcriptional regulator Spx [Marinilactibacillus psychrotolerans]|uniref:Arsenate reductase n=2 Tax=Marinilactibacillus psychrotolerans TaxID=191770 RepID=A0A511H3C7_9LACT|nr:transcriptional regulator Spx [Marinilactibacillus psychrotolerans]TLQ06469.1 Spx/MgsR family RNA polymerase-binding regulatory protein [Marinilactibacillus psychrotolerans]SDD34007.1 regulatory protein spx [Marinilactibacillus psychrotolerans]SJN30387.1 putative arsenate reductase [Marinilactibacillus psychrotolerans 42ea]GEL68025.1 regulatory protein Spx [Marinilactibacillus psychrotolerans]GEQ36670.1 arsenate reductase [Marinilactibacillus psychrotolerans]